jgi:hypothetical protein
LVGILLAAIGASLATPAVDEPDVWKETLWGEVEAAETAADGPVLRVLIDDSGWGPVLIAEQGKGQELKQLVGVTVEATGQMQGIHDEESPYDYLIVVDHFRIVDAEYEPEDPAPQEPQVRHRRYPTQAKGRRDVRRT